MTTAVFDTLKATRHLENAGIETRHAEAIVQSMAEAFDDAVATKADIAEVKVELKSMATKADVAELKADVLKIAIAVVVANVSLTVALIKLL